MDGLIALAIVAIPIIIVLVVLAKSVRIIPQARAAVVERLGRYSRTLTPGLTVVVPFIDKVRPLIDLREQVVSFPPQPVITEDNLVVSIDTVIYFQVTDPRAATYEIANFIQAIEQLTVTTLRNVIGGLNLEQTLTSRDEINSRLRGVLDEATGKWGIRVNRVELKAIDPPQSIQSSMEKQMRAERDRRAAILTAEGVKQSQILTAEGEKQAAILRAEGSRDGADAGGRGPGQGDRDGVRRDPRRQPRPEAAVLPVPADAAADRAGQRQQAVDRAGRARQGARGHRQHARRAQRLRPAPPAAAPAPAATPTKPASFRRPSERRSPGLPAAGAPKWFAAVGRAFVPVDRALHRVTGGRITRSCAFRPAEVCCSPRSGPRAACSAPVPLLYAPDGDGFIVTASNWGRTEPSGLVGQPDRRAERDRAGRAPGDPGDRRTRRGARCGSGCGAR